MKILVTGNKGYIGSILTEMLLEKGYDVAGYDTDYYNDCELYEYKKPSRQIRKDIRDVTVKDLGGVDAVIHLAALSNDPLGQLDASLTEDINLKATIKFAQCAKESRVKRFIFSSSQSMYGISNSDKELGEDRAIKNPQTAYAKTKWIAECQLKKMSSGNFAVVCLRPSTVFGAGPKLRCDIVFNNLVACAYTTGKIEIKSDGKPWRPVVHVKDVSRAFIAALEAPVNLISGESFNVGIKNGNYTVRGLAEAAKRCVPGSILIFTKEQGPDARTYKISFDKIFNALGMYFKPEWDLDKGGKELVELFKKINFTEGQFRGKTCTRLKQIQDLILTKRIDKELRWIR